jgi:hypothetical protein
MQEDSIPINADFLKDVQKISKNLDKIIIKTSQKNMTGIENLIWVVRADLELLIVKFKVVLEKDNGIERWQKTFLANHRGTGSISKAIVILKGAVMNHQDTLALYKKNPDECYKYFWKLKETISSIMAAFEEKKIYNSAYFDNDDEVFEI